MGEIINFQPEKQFNKKSQESDNVIKDDIESILELSPHYSGMDEEEKKILIDRIFDYIKKKEEKKAA
ncbi:hypothetical protein HZB05_02815 [Candidatus Wolfebacteria bacterium]|nr:hypothetical protein [Candidatus Wolfebacteria bacterium]